MRVNDKVIIDRINGSWLFIIEPHEDIGGYPQDVVVSAKDIVDAIRQYAPELLKEET